MIFEITSSALLGGIALKAALKKNGTAANDSGKIQRIFSLSGLNVKDGKQTLTTQLIKRPKRYDWGMEYKYRIPLGRSFDDYLAKLKILEDGLNNRRQRITFKELRELREVKLDRNIISSIKGLTQKKLSQRKELELSFDGVLTLRVYNEPLPKEVDWKAGEDWKVPVGVTREKNTFKYHDFEKIPHMVLGGATRYGKSNFINGLICSLLTSKPKDTNLFLIDLKGGVELCDYENIEQTVSVAYEPEDALKTLELAYESMRAMQKRLKDMGKKNVQEAGIKQRSFIIIDEVGELNPLEAVGKEDRALKEQCQKYMSQIARLGAGLGFRQILATQYPTGDVIPRQCKQNSDVKICFRVQSATASRVVLDESGAENLPQVKGRAIVQTADQKVILQTPLINSFVIRQVIEKYVITEELTKIEEVIEERAGNSVTFKEV